MWESFESFEFFALQKILTDCKRFWLQKILQKILTFFSNKNNCFCNINILNFNELILNNWPLGFVNSEDSDKYTTLDSTVWIEKS